MPDPLIETWTIHNRINLYLLRGIKPEDLAAAPARGRSTGDTFAHIHNVRLMWLKAAAPDLLAGQEKLEPAVAKDPEILAVALESSGRAIEELVAASLAAGGRVKGFKPHVHAFVGYLISHESHHRGQITLNLKQAGVPLDKKISYGLWEWGVR